MKAAGFRRADKPDSCKPGAEAQKDVFTGPVTMAAIALFGVLSICVMPHAVNMIMRGTVEPTMDRLMACSLLLDTALILLGWSRYRELQSQLNRHAIAEEEAQQLAQRDPLTGLLNQRSLAYGLDVCIERARRGEAMALMVIDLDRFKNVNDVHGHMVGDELLRRVSDLLCARLPKGALVSRMGGDEFAAAFAFDASAPDRVSDIAQILIKTLHAPMMIDGISAQIGASIGIAYAAPGDDTVTAGTLLQRADIAMYDAKRRGRGQSRWFHPDMESRLKSRNEVEAGLRRAIETDDFVPYYERQVDLTNGQLHGLEVLARWRHPTQGMIEPDAFIEIAEESGLIGDISLALIRRALIETRDLEPGITISVNISPTQLKEPWLAQKLLRLLVQTGFPPERLEVEITETALFDNLPLAQSLVGSLKNQGIRLALDDFGIGYSSLHHLRALPFDRIKIDKSFTATIVDSRESEAIVSAIMHMAESLGLPITAEGVTNRAIARRLADMGCDCGQGWHFGRPIPIEDIRAGLAASGTPVFMERLKRSSQAV